MADEDESFLSSAIGGTAVQGPIAELFDVTPVDRDEGRRIMDAGDASALVILPAGLQEAVLGRGTAEIQLVTNPSQRILPGMIEEALEIAVELAFYGERLLGGPARRILDGPPGGGDFFSNAAVAELSTAINTRLQELGDTLSPPVLTVEYADPPDADETDAPQSVTDTGVIFLPGMIFMSILFTAQGMSGDVWTEKRLGTLRRAASAPPPMAAVLAGKLLAGGALVGVVAVVGVAVGMVLLDLPPLHAPLAVLWITFAGTVMLSYFVLLQLLASGQQAGNLLSTLVLFPLVMLGGSFFPFEAMPEWMAAIGRWTPNGLALVHLAGNQAVLTFDRRGEDLNRVYDQLRVGRAVYTVLADLAAASLLDGEPSPEAFAALAAAPRTVTLQVSPAGRRETPPTGYSQAIPGTMVMFTMLVLLSSGGTQLVIERKEGLLRRLASTPVRPASVVAGKWTARMALGLVQVGFAMLLGRVLFGMDWGAAVGMVGLVLAAWAAFNASLALLLGNFARTEGQMAGIGMLGTMALAALGGCWWPIEITPAWMQALALWLPTGWTMDALHKLVSFGYGPAAALPHVAALATGALLCAAAAARTFRYQ